MEIPPVRLRLVFDRTVISKIQKEEGLKRCWLLLKPQQHKSISDLSSHLLSAFHLHDSCPSGLLLTMEGFCLPSFESTSIFRDNDVVRVKRKETGSGMEMIEVKNNARGLLGAMEIANQPPRASAGGKLLANEEFSKESGGYESESEEEEDDDASHEGEEDGALAFSVEDAPQMTVGASKKRKASEELHDVRQKKKKQDDVQNDKVVRGDVGKNAAGNLNGNVSLVKVNEKSNKKHKLSANKAKSSPQENGRGSEDASDTLGETKKLPSRSACRKKAKRRWLRELKAQSKEPDQSHVLQQDGRQSHENNDKSAERLHRKVPEKLANGSDKGPSVTLHQKAQKKLANGSDKGSSEKLHRKVPEKLHNGSNKGSSEKLQQKVPEKLHNGSKKESSEKLQMQQKVPEKLSIVSEKPEKGTQSSDEDSEEEDDVVPVVIKPGHIRFQPLRTVGDEKAVQKDDLYAGTYQWNGTSSKKRGQKWGTEKAAYSTWEDYRSFDEDHTQAVTTEEEKPKHDQIDYDKLDFYATLPKVGDVIAYRLIELSSSWAPEISSYRVGKILEYDMVTNKILLTPVPQHPIPKKMIDIDANGELTETDSYGDDYKEDGSLEISYASLVEVRVVSHGKENPAQSVPFASNEVLAREGKTGPSWKYENHNGIASTQENERLDTLEELQQMVEWKKQELMQGGDRSQPDNSRRSWSHRALRGSALGPIMALLRSENGE